MLIVDEYVRTDKEVVDRVFKPMLTSPRHPPYRALSKAEREKIGEEPQRQLFLSSIRSADEWSYKEFEDYIDKMTDGKLLVARPEIPWEDVIGMRNHIAHGYFDIDGDIVFDVVKNNLDDLQDAIQYFIGYRD